MSLTKKNQAFKEVYSAMQKTYGFMSGPYLRGEGLYYEVPGSILNPIAKKYGLASLELLEDYNGYIDSLRG